ncbi:MAG: phosphotransferase [Patescibacteria group bacterium]|nr:phosphotransferase [Patescibacteria group bacterium]
MNKSLLTDITDYYQLPTAASNLERVAKGVLSENYVIMSGRDKFFLKKYRFDNEQKIKEIHLAKQYFADGDIPVILPLRTRTQDTFFLHDTNYYALFPFVAGRHLEREALTSQAISSMGKMLARIHLRGRDSTLAIENTFNPWNKEIFLAKAAAVLEKIPQGAAASDFDMLALRSVRLKMELATQNTTTFDSLRLSNDHLLHGDYLDHNVFFDAQDNVEYVFDFEKTQYGPRSYELFRSVMYSLLSSGTTNGDIRRAELYLRAYLESYPMPDDEIERGLRAYYLKSIHSIWIEHEHYVLGNTRPDVFLKADLERISFFIREPQLFDQPLHTG